MPALRAKVGKPMPQTEAVLLALLDVLEARTEVSSPDALLAHVLRGKLAPRRPTGKGTAATASPAPPAEIEPPSDEDLAEFRRNMAELSKSE